MKIIYINTRQYHTERTTINFYQACEMASMPAVDGMTVTWRKGHRDKPEGQLTGNLNIPVVEGMVINVAMTNNA